MTYEKEIEILLLTSGGEGLTDWQYSLVHWSMNPRSGGLTDSGKEKLDRLYELVKNGEKYRYTNDSSLVSCYSKISQNHPLDVVKELDYNHQGHIFWKGEIIGCINDPDEDRYIPFLWYIVEKCQHFESIGLSVDCNILQSQFEQIN
jgi:hypothetical protein